jgi:hypothetical protein
VSAYSPVQKPPPQSLADEELPLSYEDELPESYDEDELLVEQSLEPDETDSTYTHRFVAAS